MFSLRSGNLWLFDFAANSRTYSGLHAEFQILLPDFKQIRLPSSDYLKVSSIVFHGNPSCGMRDETCKQTARRTDVQSEARDEDNRHFSRLCQVLKTGGIRIFSNEIIAIPDLVKLSTLTKFETGNTMYRTRDRQTDRLDTSRFH